jgi:type II secretory pathway component PulJ
MLVAQRSHGRRSQSGLSLVELMVGVTIGLMVVAATSLMVTTQLNENRKLITETQLQQDLRATADIISRELRRAGTWGLSSATNGVWYSGSPRVQCNLFATVTPATGVDSTVTYRYWRSSNEIGPLGFKLDEGVIKYSMATNIGPDTSSCAPTNDPGNWHELTDPRAVTIESFTITPATDLPKVQLPCPKRCADGTKNCWPTIEVRALTINIQGTSTYDSNVKRNISSTVRLRNDHVQFNDTANPTRSCPV